MFVEGFDPAALWCCFPYTNFRVLLERRGRPVHAYFVLPMEL
jgi:hypothetical protein